MQLASSVLVPSLRSAGLPLAVDPGKSAVGEERSKTRSGGAAMQSRRRTRQGCHLPSVSAAARVAAAVTAALLAKAPAATDGFVTSTIKACSENRRTSSRPGGNSCSMRRGSAAPATSRTEMDGDHTLVSGRLLFFAARSRACEGGHSSSASSSLALMMTRDARKSLARTRTTITLDAKPPNRGTDIDIGGGGGGGRTQPAEGSGTWRRIGDVPSLVVGVGFLVARHRRELRASNERRHAESARSGEEAAAVAGAAAVGVTASGMVPSKKRHGGVRSARKGRRRNYMSGDRKEGDGEEAEEGLQDGEVDEEEWREAQEVTQDHQRQYGREGRVNNRRSAPEHALPSRTSVLDVSLDRCVLPEPVGPFVAWGTGVSASLAAVAMVARIPRVVGAIGNTVTQTVEPAYRQSQLPEIVGNLRYASRLWAGSLRAWASQRAEAWERAFGPEVEMLPAEDWSVCTLQERNLEGGHVVRYRFGLQDSPNAVLPLELGQEMTLCGLDASNHVVHGNYVPLTPRKQRGYFDIAVRRGSAELGNGFGSTRSEREFFRFLDSLPLGDEIAVKPGREGLVYNGPYSPVTDLVLIATGLGVVPMIQMVNELLPSRDSSVSSASVIWLNENAEDFALYGHLEEAFFRNHRKLDVSCIVERDLFGHHLESNANLREAAPDFKTGTLAAVAGPDFFVRKVSDYLVRRGYPEDAIIIL